ncbi:MAG: type VI secretion system tip protein VgrG [Myxococcales bacterium]|nr:type VI secretion system tip protein VgrG [Myxococcales bacterium]
MNAERTLPIPATHREFLVTANGNAVSREHALLSLTVNKMVNKLASARLVYLDGAPATGDFPLSNADTFVPGTKIQVAAVSGGTSSLLFVGVVVKCSLKVREAAGTQLVIECRHDAVKLTVGRRSAYFLEQSDSDVIESLVTGAGLSADIEATPVIHKHQVQYNCTDWDFLLLRARANGQLVFAHQEPLVVKAPTESGEVVCTLQFGATILEMDVEMDARGQYAGIQTTTWDPASQQIVVQEGENPGITTPGNIDPQTLSSVVGLKHFPLSHVALPEDEAQAWADSTWRHSQMSRINGRIKCEGIGTVNPGDWVKLDGIGQRFSGNAYVTGVRHDFDQVQGWKTHVQVGSVDAAAEDDVGIHAPKASRLVAGVNGLQIGVVVSNEDSTGEHRIRVRMPMVSNDEDGAWARVACMDAGADRGFFFRPEVGDEVVLGFLNDDPRAAVILGMLHSSAKPAPLLGSDPNHDKVYQSRSKLRLAFNDETKTIVVETPAGNRLTLSEEDSGIRVGDQNGNIIEMSPSGISIQSVGSLTLNAATEMTQTSGTASSWSAGTQLTLKGAAGADVSSSGVTKVRGSLVQIN